MAYDISCHTTDLTTRNEFHNGKAQKKGKRWIDRDLLAGLRSLKLRAIVRRLSSRVLEKNGRRRRGSCVGRVARAAARGRRVSDGPPGAEHGHEARAEG